jgi:putative two-component system response regulator
MAQTNRDYKLKILFIDDDTMTLELMKKEAEILGYTPILCPDSSDVIRYIMNSDPDLIVVDINMQSLNGYEVVSQIRNYDQAYSIPVLMLSAGDPNIEGRKALEEGANGFLVKPLTLSGMQSAVNGYINNQQRLSIEVVCQTV